MVAIDFVVRQKKRAWFMNTESSKSITDGNAWIVALVVLCLAILGYGAFYSTNAISNPAFLAGQYSVNALFIWVVFYFLFIRNRGSKIGSIAFAAIFLALFTGALFSAKKQKQQATQAVSSIQQELNRLVEGATDSNGSPTRLDRAVSKAPVATGEFGEMERFMKSVLDKNVALRNDYLLEFEAIGWVSILDAKRIKNDASLSKSRAMVDRAKAIVDKYEAKTAEMLQGARAEIDSLNLSDTSKKSMLAGFEKGVSESAKQLDEQWRLEKETVRQFENIFLMLAANKEWVVDGDQLLFYTEEDLAQYNSYLQTIQDLTQQQELLQKRNLSEVNQKLESIKNANQR